MKIKTLKYILFNIVLLLNLIFVANVFWAWQIKYDCSIATKDKSEFLDDVSNSDFELIDEDVLDLAYDHLESYCCEKWFVSWSACSASLPPEYPESPYYYDHVIDIWFRKLDWNEDLLYSRIDMDEDALSWREEVREFSTEEDVNIPQQIRNKFDEYWDVWWFDWLHGKLQRVCIESKAVQESIFSILSDDVSVDDLHSSCLSMVDERVQREIAYLRWVLSQRWNHLLETNLNTYLDKYFARNRAIDMLEKFVYFEWLLMQVTKKVNEWTPQCSPW